MIKRIIFDIDGTLITGIDFSSYIKNALNKFGINNQDKVNLFLSNIKEYEKKYSSYDYDLYLNFFSDKLSCKLNDVFLEIFFEELKKAIPTNSYNINKILYNLGDYELVLLSNFFEVSQRNRLEAMGINKYFSEYYGEKIIKPNKKVYIDCSRRYNNNECLIIGDDKKLDIDIPKQMGFNTLFINELGDIKSVEEITPKLIKKLNNHIDYK